MVVAADRLTGHCGNSRPTLTLTCSRREMISCAVSNNNKKEKVVFGKKNMVFSNTILTRLSDLSPHSKSGKPKTVTKKCYKLNSVML